VEEAATILAARIRSTTVESAKEREEEMKAWEERIGSSDADKSDEVEYDVRKNRRNDHLTRHVTGE
jgi:hypothetical protein